jgi:hypothetical protein
METKILNVVDVLSLYRKVYRNLNLARATKASWTREE